MKKFLLAIMTTVLLTFVPCVVNAQAENVRIGLEKNYKQKSYIGIKSDKFKISVGNGKHYSMHLGSSVVKPISKQYYDVGLNLSTYNVAWDKMQRYLGSNCIPVLTENGWTIYITTDTKVDTSDMKLVHTGENAVVFSVNGVNKYLVDGDLSAWVSTDNDIVDLEKGRYRGHIAFYREGDALTAVNILSSEQYLYGVIASEMPSSWHMEALKAQAVAARTYLHASLGKHNVYDVCDSVHCQNYNGVNGETEKSIGAVKGTANLCMYYDGKLISTPYYSSNGGVSMNSEDVWLNATGYLKSVKDIYETGGKVWTRSFTNDSLTAIAAAKGFGIGKVKDLTAEYLSYGPVKKLTFIGENGSYSVEKDAVRTVFNVSNEGSLFSVNFKLVKNEDGTYTFNGRGNGHGVGMSQYGAKSMAERGFSFSDILKFYYTGITIE